jgi:hypothetical protein
MCLFRQSAIEKIMLRRWMNLPLINNKPFLKEIGTASTPDIPAWRREGTIPFARRCRAYARKPNQVLCRLYPDLGELFCSVVVVRNKLILFI